MSCDKPNGDCTTPKNCADCGCSETTGTPVLPKCQDTALTPGVFTNATVTVNASGCITAVAAGAPAPYTPDDCCGKSQTVAQQLSSGVAEMMAAIAPAVMPVAQAAPADYAALIAEMAVLNNRIAALEAKGA